MKVLIIVVPIIIGILLLAYLGYRAWRWRQNRLIETSPEVFGAKTQAERHALDRLALAKKELAEKDAAFRQISRFLQEALEDETVTLWGPSTRTKVTAARAAAINNIDNSTKEIP